MWFTKRSICILVTWIFNQEFSVRVTKQKHLNIAAILKVCVVHVLTLLEAQLVSEVLKPFDLLHQVGCGQTTQLCRQQDPAWSSKCFCKTVIPFDRIIGKDYCCRQNIPVQHLLKTFKFAALPFNISMSSLSSSAIHLGGELLMGCEVRHNKDLSISGLHITVYFIIKFVNQSASEANSHFYKMQQILQLQALHEWSPVDQDYCIKHIKHIYIVTNDTRARSGHTYTALATGRATLGPTSQNSAKSSQNRHLAWHKMKRKFDILYGKCIP